MNATRKYHEDTLSFQKCFFKDAAKLYSNFICNPFELGELTWIDDTSVWFDPRIIADTKLLESNGEQQFNIFWNDRFKCSKAPVTDTIKDFFCLMGDAANNVSTKRSYAYTGHGNKIIRAACVARQKHAEIFFQSKIFGIAQSISTDSRSLYHESKSDILKWFEKEAAEIYGNNSALVVDFFFLSGFSFMHIFFR